MSELNECIDDLIMKDSMLKTALADLRETKKRLEAIENALKGKIDHSTWFYKNCKIQRRKGAKICQVCPFRILIEATE
jgi:hypothetical protein